MRFSHPFSLTANSHDTGRVRPRHERIGGKSSVRCDQAPSNVRFPRAIFLGQISRPTPSRKNLTEIPFAPNFSKPDLDVLPKPNLDPRLTPFYLDEQTKKDLLAFLESLNGEGWQKITPPAAFPQ